MGKARLVAVVLQGLVLIANVRLGRVAAKSPLYSEAALEDVYAAIEVDVLRLFDEVGFGLSRRVVGIRHCQPGSSPKSC